MLTEVQIDGLWRDLVEMQRLLDLEGEKAEGVGTRIGVMVTSLVGDRQELIRERDALLSKTREGVQTWRREQIEQSYLALGYRAGEPRPALVDAIKEMLAHIETNTSRLKADVAERDKVIRGLQTDLDFLRRMREKQAAFEERKKMQEAYNRKFWPQALEGKTEQTDPAEGQVGLRDLMYGKTDLELSSAKEEPTFTLKSTGEKLTMEQFEQRCNGWMQAMEQAGKEMQAAVREGVERYLVERAIVPPVTGTDQPAIVEPVKPE